MAFSVYSSSTASLGAVRSADVFIGD